MRKQPRVLKHVADAPPVRRHVNACGGVVQRFAVERDDAAVRPQQPCDHVDQRGLAGAGRAEQAGDAALAFERGFKREFAELLGDVDAQHGQFPCRRLVARRANHSEAIRAPIAITMEISTSRAGGGIAVGRLDQRIDRRRNGLGLAGNVGDEGDGGAELADRLGKAEHHAGQYARQRQRQGHGGEHLPWCGAERARCLFQPAVDRLDRQPYRPHQQRKRHHAAGQRRAGPAKREHDAEMVGEPRADQAAAAESQQQQIAGDDRRQHQRQMNQRIEDRLAPEFTPRQQPRQRDAERRRHQRRDDGDAQRQQDGRPFGRRYLEHQVDGLTRNLKPYFSRMFFAAVERRKAR